MTDQKITRFEFSTPNGRERFVSAEAYDALQARVAELEGALCRLANHGAFQDPEHNSVALNNLLDRARQALKENQDD